MPLLLLVLGIVAPRVTLVVLALFTDLLAQAFTGLLLPLLGFLFLPVTTLVYALASVYGGGVDGGVWLVLLIVGVLIDIGAAGWHVQGRRVSAA